MFTIREAHLPEDANKLADLLKTVFKDPRFTAEFLLWKHLDNPYGKSFILVAEQGERFVGLRFFMHWKVAIGGKRFNAIRPTDTAVHPDMQKRGIFTQMALGLDFLNGKIAFNTPNSNSLPGLLKMGWIALPQQFSVYLNLRPLFIRKLSFKKVTVFSELPDGEETRFIQWRYAADHYLKAVFNDGTVMVYRRDRRKGVAFIILVDVFFQKGRLKDYVSSICSSEKVFFYMFLRSRTTASLFGTFSKKIRNVDVICRNDTKDISGEFELSLGDVEGII